MKDKDGILFPGKRILGLEFLSALMERMPDAGEHCE